MTILWRKKNTTEIDYRMELLLNLKGFKGRIQQIDRNRAKYPVEIGYTLICNITRNVSEWPIKSPDPDNEGEYLAIHYADFSEPEKARANATELITAYQEALINRSLEIEEKPVEDPIPGNLPRTRAKGPRVMDPDQAAEEAKAKREAQRKEAEAKYLQAQAPALPTIEESYMDPEEAKEIIEGLKAIQTEEEEVKDSLTTQDPEEIQTQPAVKICPKCGGRVLLHHLEFKFYIQCSNCSEFFDFQEFEKMESYPAEEQSSADQGEEQDLPADPEGEVRDQEETPEAQEENPKIEYQNHEWENVEKEEVQDKKEEILPAWNTWDEKDQALEEKIKEIRTKNKEYFERSTLDTLNKSTWTPLFSFTGPKSREVELSELAEAPELKILNEIFINKNSNGYSWRITARAASLDEAVENAIRANERLQNELMPLYKIEINENCLEPSISRIKNPKSE